MEFLPHKQRVALRITSTYTRSVRGSPEGPYNTSKGNIRDRKEVRYKYTHRINFNEKKSAKKKDCRLQLFSSLFFPLAILPQPKMS